MQFRVRPSSKKSNNNEGSLIQFPTSKSLKNTESPLPRTMGTRLDQLEASLSTFQQMYKRDRELSNAGYVQAQKRLDKVEYKMFSVDQDVRQLSEIRELKQPRQLSPISGEPSKNEIMMLKQMILQDKESHKDLIKHQNSQIEQLGMKLLRQEQEVREMIKQQRMQWQQRITGQQEQLRQVEGLKNRKMEQQYDMIKGIIANAERKIYQELERKIRNETIIKDFVEERLNQVKEELGSEHRQTLSSETKFIKETKTSLETLFAIVNTVKKQLSDELTETQKLTTGSIKRLSMALDIAREKSVEELKQATQLHRQVANQVVDLRNFVTARLEENRQIMSQMEEQTFERIDQGAVSSSRASPELDHDRFSLFQKQISQWKSLTQQKNLNVFKEISNTLKAMKLEWRKENDELVSEVAALNESLKTIKKSGPNQLKKSVQALVSIFNNQFDVLAEELETLTDMIAVAKKQSEKTFKEDLTKARVQIYEEMKNMINQKGKESNLYADKLTGRSEQNLKAYVGKEIKFSSESLSQRIDKAETSISQLQTSMKKMSLLTSSQLQDYSVKLKGFNDSYKDYLQEQRKDDMKKRMELEESMRKNANNLMDIYYKKAQFLVQGLKNNIEVAQMKEKVEAAQALDAAKDELKKQVQGARQQWQKELSQGLQKITKERETSEEMLHETIEQSINNAKRNLTNQIGNNKLEMEEKINEVKKNGEELRNEQEEKQIELKNTVLQMLRDQKKLTEQKMQTNRQQIETKLTSMQKILKDKEESDKIKQSTQKKDMEGYVAAQIAKGGISQKEELSKVKTSLEQAINQHREETKASLTKLQEDSKKQALQRTQTVDDAKSKTSELENRMKTNKQAIETKLKELQGKILETDKKIGENQAQVQKEKIASKNQTTTKQAEIQKQLAALSQDVELKNKVTTEKIEEINKKLLEREINAQKKDGEEKKVGENSLNKVKADLEKEIKNLSARIQEIQSQNKDNQTEETINTMRKSVNKLQAMVFSEQAKNKALFDRLTEDVNKLSDNLNLLTNQMRE